MKEKREGIFIITAILVLLAVSLLFAALNFERRGEQYTYIEYIVGDGDTVWDIAAEYANGEDVRKMVYYIREKNNMDDVLIHSGETLLIPTGYTGE